mgnify:CR=1 FL=1
MTSTPKRHQRLGEYHQLTEKSNQGARLVSEGRRNAARHALYGPTDRGCRPGRHPVSAQRKPGHPFEAGLHTDVATTLRLIGIAYGDKDKN